MTSEAAILSSESREARDAELPEGWTECELGDLLNSPRDIFDGPFGSSLKTSDYVEHGVRVIRLENLATFRFIGSKKTWVSEEKFETLTKHEVREGDLLVGSFVDGSVRVCMLPPLGTRAIAKADCFCVRSDAGVVDRKFLMYQLGLQSTRDALVGEIHGATRPRITTKQLRSVRLKLPPLAEQRRIVDKIEALLAHVDTARERLMNAARLLNSLRRRIIDQACSGQLTNNFKAFENGDWSTPAGWKTREFGSAVMELRNGLSPKPNQAPPGVPILRINAARPGKVSLETERYLPDAEDLLERFAIRDGDLLFTRYNGSIDLLGVCGMVRGLGTSPMLYPDKLIRVRTNQKLLLPSYAELYFQSTAAREEVTSHAKSSAGQQGISGGDLKRQSMLLPPVREQKEIVRRVEAMMTLIDGIEARITTSALSRAENVCPAILKKAFTGELVATEAELARSENRDYESAAALLEHGREKPGKSKPSRDQRR